MARASSARTPLRKILAAYRASSQTEREKSGCFEELIRTRFRYEASYAVSSRSRQIHDNEVPYPLFTLDGQKARFFRVVVTAVP